MNHHHHHLFALVKEKRVKLQVKVMESFRGIPLEDSALTGVSLALQKNKQKNPVDVLILWCVSITNGLSNHNMQIWQKSF